MLTKYPVTGVLSTGSKQMKCRHKVITSMLSARVYIVHKFNVFNNLTKIASISIINW